LTVNQVLDSEGRLLDRAYRIVCDMLKQGATQDVGLIVPEPQVVEEQRVALMQI
jgi:hypothetical protein